MVRLGEGRITVLILIVLEFALALPPAVGKATGRIVLILIVLEFALAQYKSRRCLGLL